MNISEKRPNICTDCFNKLLQDYNKKLLPLYADCIGMVNIVNNYIITGLV